MTKKSQLFIVVISMPFYLILSIFCYPQQNQDSATILLILQFYFIVIHKPKVSY
jgi:hypothetical protein